MPAVKGVTSNLYRVRLICFGFAERIALSLKVTDDLKVYSAYKKTSMGEFPGYRLIIAAGALHDNTGLTIQIPDQLFEGSEVSGQVVSQQLSRGLGNGHGAFAFGNINIYNIHIHKMPLLLSDCNWSIPVLLIVDIPVPLSPDW